ncbi:spinster family MFS transporter [Tepidicaulis sp.]|uniref:spinster family MFS transporter n=1 Tax=Tepidicaulis sp. TaxID=1920809 RepID=UPI003B5BE642
MAQEAAPVSPADKITPGYRSYALGILVLGYTSSHVDRNIVGILVEPLKADLLLSDTQIGFLSGIAFALFYATLGIPIAIWADRSNRRNIIAGAIAIWSAMTAMCGLANNFWTLALARIGVGIGEAGSSPPSHSMIADLYGPTERAGAMAIYSLGVYLGVMIGLFVGGWVTELYGWRMAFFVVGLPGVLIALLVRYTLVEPPRGHSEGAGEQEAHPPMTLALFTGMIKAGFHHLWSKIAARHVVIGVTLTSFVGYGGIAWGPAFLIRTHGMSPAEVGTWLAPLVGIVGGLGALIGGKLTDHLSKKDVRWNTWVVAVAKLAAVPFIAVFYLIDNFPAFSIGGVDISILWVLYVPISLLGAFYLGPSFAMIQTLTPLRQRALASAVMLFILNLIGLGFGPQVVGIISDVLRADYGFGVDSLRWALFGTAMLNIWAAYHYWAAGRRLKAEQQAGA